MPVTEQQPKVTSPAMLKPLSSKQLASTLRRDHISRLKDRFNDFVKYASNEEIWLLADILETRESTNGYRDPHPGVPIADAFDRLLALQKKVGKPVEPGTFRFLWPRSRDVDRQKWLVERMQTCKHLLANIFVALPREQEVFEGGEQTAPWS
jgi:hypothetical protein